MKTPEGGIDLIGTGMQIGLGVIDLVKTFAPTPEERESNRKNRKIRVAIRRLKHRFKNEPTELYVSVNFPELSPEQQVIMVNYINAALGK